MREGYDERQEQLVNRIGAGSFLVMFCICTVVIVAELMWKGNLELVMGETVILVTGGMVSLAGAFKNGLWTKTGRRMTMGQNLIMSILFAVVSSFLYAVIISRKAGADTAVGRIVLTFFLGIFVLIFIVLLVTGYAADRQRERQERKYDDRE